MFERCKQWIGRWIKPNDRFSLGPAGEKAAANYLKRLGYRILARGHRQRLGEIDLIALDGKWIVFVEVKTWASNQGGDPSQAVDARKQEILTRAALVYLKRRGLLEQPARFDVVSIVWPSLSKDVKSEPTIRHFKNAFDAVGNGQMYR
jgi:putative endonuclease